MCTMFLFLFIFVFFVNSTKVVVPKQPNECLVDDIIDSIKDTKEKNARKIIKEKIKSTRKIKRQPDEKTIDSVPIDLTLSGALGGESSVYHPDGLLRAKASVILGFEYKLLVSNRKLIGYLGFVPRVGLLVRADHLIGNTDKDGNEKGSIYMQINRAYAALNNNFNIFNPLGWTGGKRFDAIFFIEPTTTNTPFYNIYPRFGIGASFYYLSRGTEGWKKKNTVNDIDEDTIYKGFDLLFLAGVGVRLWFGSFVYMTINVDHKLNPILWNLFTKNTDQCDLLSVFFDGMHVSIGLNFKFDSSIEKKTIEYLKMNTVNNSFNTFSIIVNGGFHRLRINDPDDKYRGLGDVSFSYNFKNGLTCGIMGIMDFVDRYEKDNIKGGTPNIVNKGLLNFAIFGGYRFCSKLVKFVNVLGIKMFGITEDKILSTYTLKKISFNRFFYTSKFDIMILKALKMVRKESLLNGVVLSIGCVWDVCRINLTLADLKLPNMAGVNFKTFMVGIGYEF